MNGELVWRKSSFSDNQGGECVEVATVPGLILLRDSKFTTGPRLAIGAGSWNALLSATARDLKA